MAAKTYSADEVFSIMDSLQGGQDTQEPASVSETQDLNMEQPASDDYSVEGLMDATQSKDNVEGYKSANFPEYTGDWRSKVREIVARPIIEGARNPKEALKGSAKSVAKTIFNMGRLGESAFEETVGKIPKIWGGNALGRSEKDLETEMKILQFLSAENPAQQFGAFAEGFAEAVIPGTLATKGVSNVSKAKNIGKVGTAALEIGTQGAVAGAQEAVAQGEFNQEAAKAALVAAGATGAFEGLGATWRAFKGTPLREELTANVLGPSKGMAKQFDDASEGLVTIAESIPGGQAKIAKELSKQGGREAYTQLANRATQMQDGIWADLTDKLSGITAKARTTEAGEAIGLAKEALSTQPGNEARKALLELENLGAKNVKEGLTPLEMTRVKILYTQAENMYNALGAEVKGMSADALRDVRSALKDRIEKEAAKSGVTGIDDLNAQYGKLAAAKNMLENRKLDYVAFTGRQMRETVLQKAARALMELPIVKQTITQPAQTVAAMIGKGIRSDKVNVLEVEKQIPYMLNELKKLGLKQSEFKVAEAAIKSAIRSEAVRQEQEYRMRQSGELPNA